MALQKQKISLGLVKGTDTKTNDQISKNFKDMENVVFTGDLTAKKMNGFDLVGTISNDDLLSINTKEDDLLIQGVTGTYKYQESFNTFNKISELGNSSVEKLNAFGQYACFGQDYNVHASVIDQYTVKPDGTKLKKWSMKLVFTDKKNKVINTDERSFGLFYSSGAPLDGWTPQYFFRAFKIVANGNDFYVIHPQDGLVNIFKFALSGNAFSSSALLLFDGTLTTYKTTYEDILTMDMMTDGSNIYLAIKNKASSGSISGVVAKQALYKISLGLSVVTKIDLSQTIDGNIQLFNKDATNIYLSAPKVVSGNSELHQYLTPKTTLTYSLDSLISSGIATNGSNTRRVHWSSYPLTDSTAVYTYTIVDQIQYGITYTAYYSFAEHRAIQTSNQSGVTPVSKIFKHNNNYYFFGVLTFDEQWTYILFRIVDNNIYPQAVFGQTNTGYTEITQLEVSNYNVSTDNGPSLDLDKWLYTFQDPCIYNNEIYFASRWINPHSLPLFYKISLSQNLNNNFIESNGCAMFSGGVNSYYDGVNFNEYGFIGKPSIVSIGSSSTGGLMPAGDYRFYAIFKWTDANGKVVRSQPSNLFGAPDVFKAVGSTTKINFFVYAPIVTTKENVYIQLYASQGTDPFALQVETIVPAGNFDQYGNFYARIDVDTYTADLQTETLYTKTKAENKTLLPVKSLGLYADSIFYVSGEDKQNIYYSKPLEKDSFVDFDYQTFFKTVYEKRGHNEDAINSICAMDGRLFVLKERSIIYISGDVGDPLNGNTSLSTPQLVTTDVGCINQRSVILSPDGIMFMSDKGIYLLDRRLIINYIGAPVERFNSYTITSAVLVENYNEIRFTTKEGILLVYNYFSQAWSWFTNLPTLDSCIWKGKHTLLLTDGKIIKETTAHKKLITSSITQKISTPWITLNEFQGWQKVYDVLILGKYKSEHQVKISVYYDYEIYPEETRELTVLESDQYNINSRPTNEGLQSGTEVDGVYQLTIDMVRKSCQAFRIEIEDLPLNIENNTGESFSISTIEVTIGKKKGPAKLPAYKSY